MDKIVKSVTRAVNRRKPPQRRMRSFGKFKRYTGVREKPWTVRSTYRNTPIVSSNTTDVVGSLAFQLNAFPNISDYIQMFQQYRIKEITVQFDCNVTETVSGSSFADINEFFTTINRTAAAPVTIADVVDMQDCVCTRANERHERSFRPQYFLKTENVASPSTYGLMVGTGWLSTSEAVSTTHWGLNYAWPQTSGGYLMRVTVTAVLEFRYQK